MKTLKPFAFAAFVLLATVAASFAVVPAAFSADAALSAAESFGSGEILTKPGDLKAAAGHIQGFDCDENYIYAAFTNYVCKIDKTGAVVKGVAAPEHSGDVCVVDDRVYVSMSTADGSAVYEYDLDLNLTRKLKLEKCGGADGIAFLDGSFYIGGPSQEAAHRENYVLRYDRDFNLIADARVDFGFETNYGPQSITAWNGRVLFAFYAVDGGGPQSAWTDAATKPLGRTRLYGGEGWAVVPESKKPDAKTAKILAAKTIKFAADGSVDENWRNPGETGVRFRVYEFDGETLKTVK